MSHILEAILNHVSGHKGGVAGVYNRALYESEMREALERWADRVEAITSEGAPIPIAREARPRIFNTAYGIR